MLMRVSLSAAILLLTGCAGPIGPPFGPGPEADSMFASLVILVFVGLLYRMAKGQNLKRPESPAIHILRERYARGELTREQFRDMLRDLSAPQTASDRCEARKRLSPSMDKGCALDFGNTTHCVRPTATTIRVPVGNGGVPPNERSESEHFHLPAIWTEHGLLGTQLGPNKNGKKC
jgi:hypothetical protein